MDTSERPGQIVLTEWFAYSTSCMTLASKSSQITEVSVDVWRTLSSEALSIKRTNSNTRRNHCKKLRNFRLFNKSGKCNFVFSISWKHCTCNLKVKFLFKFLYVVTYALRYLFNFLSRNRLCESSSVGAPLRCIAKFCTRYM